MTVKDIYQRIDRDVPFACAENWDNCGILAGDPNAEVTKALLALDITSPVIDEANAFGAELIISHHPVIFDPLRSVGRNSTVGKLLRYGISAICTHTPFDMSPCGMNKGLYDLLSGPLGLCPMDKSLPLEDMGNGMCIGRIYDLNAPLEPKDMAVRLKAALGCTVVRYTGGGYIRRAAISSGAGSSMVNDAIAGGYALITGDLRHNNFVDAINAGISVFDCGHYHTEIIFTRLMRDLLHDTGILLYTAENSTDPVSYII